MRLRTFVACLLLLSLAPTIRADDKARFDLAGPRIDVRVTRGKVSLPIAQVPNLLPGDRIWIKADLPATQSNHLLVIVAFLRGTTNEPPDNWFTEIETWDKKTAEGTTITVPEGAEQAIMFVAPETGGDFKTLRSAVKGRPGLFIRADVDLNEASFEQQRIERYLDAMKTVAPNDKKAISEHSTKLAATLALKPNADCFKKPVDQQVFCLTQASAPVLLNDGHGQSVAEAVSTGPSSDFINAASYTQPAGGGLYSAYVGAIVDLVHLASMLHTAQYQYIPAISFPQEATLNLKLNAPPSFHNPKSVIVIGLPAIQKTRLPPLRPLDPDLAACLLQPKMVLPLEGAPLVFSTSFAHGLTLHLNRTGAPTDIALTPDAFEGGLIRAKDEPRKPLQEEAIGNADTRKPTVRIGNTSDIVITGTVRGYWGFDTFEGPTVNVQQLDGKDFKIVSDAQPVAGKDVRITLKANGTACVQHIALASTKEKDIDVTFKPSSEKDKVTKDSLELEVPLQKAKPGEYALAIQQYGESNPDKVQLTAYSGDIKLESLKIHTGDSVAVLTGEGLKDVASVEIAKQEFSPIADGSDDKTLHLHSGAGSSPANGADAAVKLKDGRTMKVKIATEAARPALKLLSFKASASEQKGSIPVRVGAQSDIPLNGHLTFVVQSVAVFPRSQAIEVGTADGAVHTRLSLAGKDLILQDEHTAIATLDPQKEFGQSAFGKLQMRPVSEDGTPGEWTALGNLVRTPQITAIHCTTAEAATCTVVGEKLFLVEAFGAGKDFVKPATVPSGFAEGSFTVPTPTDGTTLYLKLRDDPGSVATVTLPTPVQKVTALAATQTTVTPASAPGEAAPQPKPNFK